jgi:hypothetical protein
MQRYGFDCIVFWYCEDPYMKAIVIRYMAERDLFEVAIFRTFSREYCARERKEIWPRGDTS